MTTSWKHRLAALAVTSALAAVGGLAGPVGVLVIAPAGFLAALWILE